MKRFAVFSDLICFIAYSNIFIAICAICQSLVTFKQIGANTSYAVICIVFFATLYTYNFNILIGEKESDYSQKSIRDLWIFSHYKLIFILLIISTIGIIPALFFISKKSILLLALLGVFSITYGYPLFQFNHYKLPLRRIPYLKLFLISLIWSLGCVLLPILESDKGTPSNLNNLEIFILVIKRFILIAAITIPFDIKDIESDRRLSLKTIPSKFGKTNAKLISLFLLFIYLLIHLCFHPNFHNLMFIALILNVIICSFVIHYAESKSDLFYYLCLDGLLILQYFLIVFV